MNAFRVLAGAALVAMSACSVTADPSTPSPSAAASRVGGSAEEIGCADPLTLRGPDGKRVNLTGLWAPVEAAEPSWNVRQVNSCFFLAEIGSEPPPDYYDRICVGEIGSAFVITARCVDFLHVVSQPVMGREYFLINFADGGVVELERCLELDEPATCQDPAVRWAPAT